MKSKIGPYIWGSLVIVLALVLAFYVASREKLLFEASQIISPDYSFGPVVAYFFGVVLVLALVLFLTPLNRLRIIFRILFALMFAWGVLIATGLILPAVATYAIAAIAGLAWFFWARIWLHNLLLLVTLSSAGSTFGFLVSPLTFLIFMVVIAVYDVVAVRFGFMVWMADKLSESTALPAFIFPRRIGDWTLPLQKVRVGELKSEEPDRREYAVLGGGDIGFPLMLAVAVYFAANLAGAIVVGAFAWLGLIVAFLIQSIWLRGKPMPALPPITFFSIIGFFIALRFLSG